MRIRPAIFASSSLPPSRFAPAFTSASDTGRPTGGTILFKCIRSYPRRSRAQDALWPTFASQDSSHSAFRTIKPIFFRYAVGGQSRNSAFDTRRHEPLPASGLPSGASFCAIQNEPPQVTPSPLLYAMFSLKTPRSNGIGNRTGISLKTSPRAKRSVSVRSPSNSRQTNPRC